MTSISALSTCRKGSRAGSGRRGHFGVSNVGVAVCDNKFRFLAINDPFAARNGVPAKAHLGKTLREILGDAAGQVEPAFQSVFDTGQPLVDLERTAQLPTRKELGHWIENFFPIKDAAGRVKQVVAVVVEITKQKKLKKTLHTLIRKLLRLKDEEDRRIARLLNDSINQYVAALKINLVLLSRPNWAPEKRTGLLKESIGLVNHCISEASIIAYLLYPPLMHELGFCSAAKWYVRAFAERSGIYANLKLPRTLPRLHERVEIVLFRVLQESLTNVHRHARALVVDIHLKRMASRVVLEIRDHGRGIPLEQLRRLQETEACVGVGVTTMRERIHDVGGRLKIQADDHGTVVTATIPESYIARKLVLPIRRRKSG